MPLSPKQLLLERLDFDQLRTIAGKIMRRGRWDTSTREALVEQFTRYRKIGASRMLDCLPPEQRRDLAADLPTGRVAGRRARGRPRAGSTRTVTTTPMPPHEVFSPRNSRLARVLMAWPWTTWTYRTLWAATGLSAPRLADLCGYYRVHGWIFWSRNGLQRTGGPGLLEAWAAVGGGEPVRATQQFLMCDEHREAAIQRLAAALPGRIAFTQHLAANFYVPNDWPTISFYHLGIPGELVDALRGVAVPVDTGGNLISLRYLDTGVFQGMYDADDLPSVSVPQIYLDLVRAGPESADLARRVLRLGAPPEAAGAEVINFRRDPRFRVRQPRARRRQAP